MRVYDLIRAVTPPYPGAFTELGGHRLVVAAARRVPAERRIDAAPPGAGLVVAGDRAVGVCGDGGRVEIRSLLCDGSAINTSSLASLLTHQPAHRMPS